MVAHRKPVRRRPVKRKLPPKLKGAVLKSAIKQWVKNKGKVPRKVVLDRNLQREFQAWKKSPPLRDRASHRVRNVHRSVMHTLPEPRKPYPPSKPSKNHAPADETRLKKLLNLYLNQRIIVNTGSQGPPRTIYDLTQDLASSRPAKRERYDPSKVKKEPKGDDDKGDDYKDPLAYTDVLLQRWLQQQLHPSPHHHHSSSPSPKFPSPKPGRRKHPAAYLDDLQLKSLSPHFRRSSTPSDYSTPRSSRTSTPLSRRKSSSPARTSWSSPPANAPPRRSLLSELSAVTPSTTTTTTTTVAQKHPQTEKSHQRKPKERMIAEHVLGSPERLGSPFSARNVYQAILKEKQRRLNAAQGIEKTAEKILDKAAEASLIAPYHAPSPSRSRSRSKSPERPLPAVKEKREEGQKSKYLELLYHTDTSNLLANQPRPHNRTKAKSQDIESKDERPESETGEIFSSLNDKEQSSIPSSMLHLLKSNVASRTRSRLQKGDGKRKKRRSKKAPNQYLKRMIENFHQQLPPPQMGDKVKPAFGHANSEYRDPAYTFLLNNGERGDEFGRRKTYQPPEVIVRGGYKKRTAEQIAEQKAKEAQFKNRIEVLNQAVKDYKKISKKAPHAEHETALARAYEELAAATNQQRKKRIYNSWQQFYQSRAANSAAQELLMVKSKSLGYNEAHTEERAEIRAEIKELQEQYKAIKRNIIAQFPSARQYTVTASKKAFEDDKKNAIREINVILNSPDNAPVAMSPETIKLLAMPFRKKIDEGVAIDLNTLRNELIRVKKSGYQHQLNEKTGALKKADLHQRELEEFLAQREKAREHYENQAATHEDPEEREEAQAILKLLRSITFEEMKRARVPGYYEKLLWIVSHRKAKKTKKDYLKVHNIILKAAAKNNPSVTPAMIEKATAAKAEIEQMPVKEVMKRMLQKEQVNRNMEVLAEKLKAKLDRTSADDEEEMKRIADRLERAKNYKPAYNPNLPTMSDEKNFHFYKRNLLKLITEANFNPRPSQYLLNEWTGVRLRSRLSPLDPRIKAIDTALEEYEKMSQVPMGKKAISLNKKRAYVFLAKNVTRHLHPGLDEKSPEFKRFFGDVHHDIEDADIYPQAVASVQNEVPKWREAHFEMLRKKLISHIRSLIQAVPYQRKLNQSIVGNGKPQTTLEREQKIVKKEGLSDQEINNIMLPYAPSYLGCIASDEVSRLLPLIHPRTRISWVMNLSPREAPEGSHWVSVYIDARPPPVGQQVIHYYDSFAHEPHKSLLRQLKPVVDRLDPEGYLKLKVNRLVQQADESTECGYFASKALIDAYAGKHWTDITPFNEVAQGEKDIHAFKQRLGLKPFLYLGSSRREKLVGTGLLDQGKNLISNTANNVINTGTNVVNSGVNAVTGVVDAAWQRFQFTVREHASPEVRSFLDNQGQNPVQSLTVCRQPIQKAIKMISNIMSLGKFNQNAKRLNYDDIFHLFMIVNQQWIVEKNEVWKVSPYTARENTETQMVPQIPPNTTIVDLFRKAETLVGPKQFWVYNPITANCQYGIRWMLEGIGALTAPLNQWIMQDSAELLRGSPLLARFTVGVTDFAARLDTLLHGKGKIRGGAMNYLQVRSPSQMWVERPVGRIITPGKVTLPVRDADPVSMRPIRFI